MLSACGKSRTLHDNHLYIPSVYGRAALASAEKHLLTPGGVDGTAFVGAVAERYGDGRQCD